ncbi:MAG TPA: enoyl-CoA hydratase [Pseudomonadales bacterium]|nr:enoyl-CoA hydratase [Pseudomonadales bacterium]
MDSTEPFTTIRVDAPDPGVARIMLNRPDKANAQSPRMLHELNRALEDASRDGDVKVIVIAAEGRHFSSGHDLAGDDDWDAEDGAVGPWSGFAAPGVEGNWAFEEEYYFGLCWRWRNLPKPTVVAVHGKVIAGGLMLVWPFDLVVASEDATFADPVVAFGVNGVEYFAHPWEFGVRKAKELLFTGRAITARVAQDLGMVNRVVPREALMEQTLELAREIAAQPMMGLKLAKESVNQTQNSQGLYESLRAAMAHQQMGHAHNRIVHGMSVDPGGAEIVRRLAKSPPLEE